jgi:acyl-CoA synthetase (AMP-forming)/AMP-acid ligase II
MLSQVFLEEAIPDNQPAVVTHSLSTTWSEMREQARAIVSHYGGVRQRRIGLSFPPTAKSYAALTALENLACDIFLLDAHLPLEEMLRLARGLKLGALLVASKEGESSLFRMHELPGEGLGSSTGTVTVLTSGSTGEPKAARHSWESLGRPVREDTRQSAPRWLLTYRPNLYAGLQVMLQCFANRGTLAVVEPEMNPQLTAQFMRDAEVQYVSATPSFWRRILMFAEGHLLRKVPIKQITLGGEVVDQPILDKLRQHFPNARLVHIYATTELGRCFSVSDGIAGFPSSFLNKALPDQVELKVQEGELFARSPNAMRMYDPYSSNRARMGDWFATGDLVEEKRDRFYFVGRKSDMINVAGSKVYPIEVERTIRAIPGVSDVRVFGKTSSIAGELVACEFVPDPNHNAEALRETIIRVCRTQLATHQQPRLIKIVDRIDMSSAGKTLRTKTP